MKYVDRKLVAVPAVLAETDSKAARERTRVRTHYNNPECTTYPFSAYKDKDVVTALSTLFNNKCAYCEGYYQATSPTDVEHFRPKGRVSGVDKHKGYWWLASTWSNLLASCIICNREQHNEIFNHATNSYMTAPLKSGKFDYFPLKSAHRAFIESDDLSLEDPLLIDPTDCDPATYITWATMQGLQVIIPLHENDITTPHAETSIKIYGLNRRKLAEDRTRIALAIEVDANQLYNHMNYACTLEQTQLDAYMPILQDTIDNFIRKKDNHPQYAGMIEHLIAKKLKDIHRKLEEIKAKYT